MANHRKEPEIPLGVCEGAGGGGGGMVGRKIRATSISNGHNPHGG